MNKEVPRHQRPSPLTKLLFGAPHYPEHSTAEEMKEDGARMAAAGVNVVRMAEFAWDLMEPRRGEFDFLIFDQAIADLGGHGVDTILCTPTATPPRWLTVDHEDWMRVDANDRRMVHGSRQQCCTNNPGFRAESERITRAMAAHFAGNPHVIGWQTDNELYCHMSECYCAACVEAFRGWLRKKYGTVAALNAAWGNRFWALTYDSFEQIGLPYSDRPTYANPGQHLDYFRFLSDGVCEFQQGQVKILREVQPRWWVTHNGAFPHIDYWKFTEDLDFLGVDVYPGFAGEQPGDFHWGALRGDETRAASGSFIVPEQQGGAGGQRPYLHEALPPGQMRLWAYQSIAHGADGMLHFRWRTCRFGAEIYWNGILDHDNIPRRRYREFSQEGNELKQFGAKILGTAVLTRAAILIQCDQDEAWTTMQLGLPDPGRQRKVVYRELLTRHLPAGVVDASDSFEGLDIIFLPGFVLMDEDLASRLDAFVRRGGILVATARTATRDRNNQVIPATPPGLLAAVFGITVEEFGKLRSPLVALEVESGGSIPLSVAYEILNPMGAETLARWSGTADGSPHAAPGEAGICLNRLGNGVAIYIGTYYSAENAGQLVDLALKHATIAPLAAADGMVEITCRHAEGRKLYFVLNHYGQQKKVANLPEGIDLISGKLCTGEITLAPYEVAIIQT